MNVQVRVAAVVTSLCATAALTVAAPPVPADPCDPLYQAGIKSIQTPHHVYSTTTPKGGQPQNGEAIYAGGVEYLQLKGQWMRSPTPQQEMLDAARERLNTHSDVCTVAADGVAGGQAVTVYTVHSKEQGTDQQVRVLKSSGLLQSSTLTLPNGSVVETRYEYSNVQAPVVK